MSRRLSDLASHDFELRYEIFLRRCLEAVSMPRRERTAAMAGLSVQNMSIISGNKERAVRSVMPHLGHSSTAPRRF